MKKSITISSRQASVVLGWFEASHEYDDENMGRIWIASMSDRRKRVPREALLEALDLYENLFEPDANDERVYRQISARL